MFIPGFIIAWLTFPGVIAHELGHLLMCKIAGVKVKEYCLFRFSTTGAAGYVVHEKPKELFKTFLITAGPFLYNSALAFFVLLFAFLMPGLVAIPLMWIGISIGMHAFPSSGDGKNLFHAAWGAVKKGDMVAAIYLPVVGVIYLGALLSFFWADLWYALGIFAVAAAIMGSPFAGIGIAGYQEFSDGHASFDYPNWDALDTEDFYDVKVASDYAIFMAYHTAPKEVDWVVPESDGGIVTGENEVADFNEAFLIILFELGYEYEVESESSFIMDLGDTRATITGFTLDDGNEVLTGTIYTIPCGASVYSGIFMGDVPYDVSFQFMDSFTCFNPVAPASEPGL